MAEAPRRPPHEEVSHALNKMLQHDSVLMSEAVKHNSIVGGENGYKIATKLSASLPYKWKPTVPPCLAGWVPTQNDT